MVNLGLLILKDKIDILINFNLKKSFDISKDYLN